MDWLEKMEYRIRTWYGRLSLKQALVLYLTIGLVTAFLCSIVVIRFFDNWKNLIEQVNGYVDMEYAYQDGKLYIIHSKEYSTAVSPDKQQLVSKQTMFLNVLETLLIILCAGTAIYVTAHQFYQKKLEEPLAILKLEMQYLSRDDLSFECSYMSGDEMGEICYTLNRMRLQLARNKRNLWELMEGQRELNAAFAHDIRTPLTVLKGYTQMLCEQYPTGRISEKRLLEILHLMEYQEERMEQFSATMKEIHNMEEWQIELKDTLLSTVYENLKRNLCGMATEEIAITVTPFQETTESVILDEHLIQEVADNLVSNALRFAKSEITITLQVDGENLYLYVKDDGEGFSREALEKAKRPYYSSEPEHFGLGLAICQTLCKKHGGGLELLNSMEQGAIVCGIFYVK